MSWRRRYSGMWLDSWGIFFLCGSDGVSISALRLALAGAESPGQESVCCAFVELQQGDTFRNRALVDWINERLRGSEILVRGTPR